ncbi:MAG: cytochrome c peroxidase [Pseudomonadota bacterium]|nr:cytochrome c peroxidase [Pseudomonadota bacterium]
MNIQKIIFSILITFSISIGIYASSYIPNNHSEVKVKVKVEAEDIDITKELYLIEEKANAEPIPPIPETLDLNIQKVLLGEKLFHDKNLSADKTISCASCHDLSKGGTDHRPQSIGIYNRLGDINTPTVFNSTFNFVQFWDGRADSLQEQAISTLFGSHEMGNKDKEAILNYLNGSNEYRLLFKSLYPTPISFNTFIDALTEFEKSLITPNSRFDKYLKGDNNALNTIELEGYQFFKTRGCISCHQGINIGGNMYQKAGIFKKTSTQQNRNLDGRYTVTKNIDDKGLLKVPSLRNIALTPPYFHDGSTDTLEIAVDVMGKAQLGTELSEQEIHKIVAFLKTLTGEYKKQPL